jgi:protein-export membrane protein SecD
MNSKLAWKSGALLAVIVWALFMVYPNFVWYSVPLSQRQELAKRKDPRAHEVIPLGLDLQGGVHLVYQVDTSKLPDLSDATVSRAVEQNMVVINNRVDAIGVGNPFVARQGREFIVIQLPGVFASEDAKAIIGKTALLEFKLVHDDEALVKIIDGIQKAGLHPEDIVAGKLPEDIKKLVPANMEVVPERDGGYLLVDAESALTGKHLKAARVDTQGHSGLGLSIDFELDGDGATLFEAFTGAHVGERLAIVLDNMVQSAPRIETRIPGGRGQITGTFTAQEAKLLANVLNSGNLQAPMNVVEERTVGPELGEDSIRSGARAMIIGLTIVLLFMVAYYKLSGFIADCALFVNFLLLLAVMTAMKATLTMPGIAGTVLTLAMAVDANVIILERVREELRRGKDVRVAIDEGYDKAFTAIFDGHVTAILAAAFLFQFGSGPVKGFGVTLMCGLIISLFTAVFATHVVYDLWFAAHKPKRLSV